MARDSVDLPVEGGPGVKNPPSPIADGWQRWNDYGIGLFPEGGGLGGQKGELRQAEPVFAKVAELGFADGWVNLARVYLREGRIPDARLALEKASKHPKPVAPWVIAWLSGQIDERNGYLDEAIARYESVLATVIPGRKFDFGQDYEVINALGAVQYARARQEPVDSPDRVAWLGKAVATLRRTIAIDSENVAAHHTLGLAYSALASRDRGEPGPIPATSETIRRLALAASDPDAAADARAEAARKLAAAIPGFLAGPREEFASRLNPLHEVVESVGSAFADEGGPATRGAQAQALASAHKALHSLFKPDETAEGRAVQIARSSNPAADQNAQSIVIHPMHRPGAPGLPLPPRPDAGRVAAKESPR